MTRLTLLLCCAILSVVLLTYAEIERSKRQLDSQSGGQLGRRKRQLDSKSGGQLGRKKRQLDSLGGGILGRRGELSAAWVDRGHNDLVGARGVSASLSTLDACKLECQTLEPKDDLYKSLGGPCRAIRFNNRYNGCENARECVFYAKDSVAHADDNLANWPSKFKTTSDHVTFAEWKVEWHEVSPSKIIILEHTQLLTLDTASQCKAACDEQLWCRGIQHFRPVTLGGARLKGRCHLGDHTQVKVSGWESSQTPPDYAAVKVSKRQ